MPERTPSTRGNRTSGVGLTWRAWTLAIVLMCCVSGCWLETPSSRFDDRAEAERSELFDKGWLPQWLPASARRIREKHDLDTSQTLLRFEFSSPDRPPFGESCAETTADALRLPSLDATWWPGREVLAGMPHLYRCHHDSGFLAIPAEGGVAYFWRMHA